MRKLLLAVAVLSVSLFACKKDTVPSAPNPPANSGEKFPVNFSVTGFLHKLEQLPDPGGRNGGTTNGLRDTALAGKVSHLYFLLYTDMGQYVKMVYQNAADTATDFGTLVDTLPANRYMISLIASTGPVQILDTTYFYGLRLRIPESSSPDEQASDPDIFVGNNSFTVTGYGQTQTIPLWPNRIMGKVEVNILDAPAPGWPGDTSVQVYASPAFRSTSVYYNSFDEPFLDPGKLLKRNSRTNFSTHLLNPYSEVTVTIIYSDKVTGERKRKDMRYVPYSRGYRTLMSGNIYAPLGGGTGFAISLDTTWNQFPEIPF
ncbi:hypothetical protein [Chitinophaga rhizophila]|uniref:Fimbrillin-A associated anchor protein Mfa1 and Mfa2 n=1 Tax=Chitinophaga rhizophila TaxID=2866212 RepID=A0ABS7G9X5_9BACT|nr:hypothetical protein [Chitinophaga rhizophila]MBW8683338.1 hypothetical protein [Chitinophaga rhizophila]